MTRLRLFIICQALVRKADQEVIDMLPRSVDIVIGDVGDPATLKAAVEGCNKIIYAATARSAITGDLIRVDHQGVYNLCKAFQVCVMDTCCLPSVTSVASLLDI